MKRILAILVQDRPGVLTRASGFSAAGAIIFRISPSEERWNPVSRMTVTVMQIPTVEQIVKQLNKLIDVLKVSDLTDQTLGREGVDAGQSKAEPGRRSEIQQMAATFRAKIIDLSPDSMIIEVTGEEQKLQAFLLMMQEFGIKEIASTGKISLLRGSKITRA